MKKLFILLFFITGFSSLQAWGESMDDLVERNGLYYKKFTNIPFTGAVVGVDSGKIKDGKKGGTWEGYHKNGQLSYIGNYKDGKKDGIWKDYNEYNGELSVKQTYKDGKLDGILEFYVAPDWIHITETYKDGKKNGLYQEYYPNGEVLAKGYHKDDKPDGLTMVF